MLLMREGWPLCHYGTRDRVEWERWGFLQAVIQKYRLAREKEMQQAFGQEVVAPSSDPG